MTVHEIAFFRVKRTFAKLTVEQINTQFGGNVGEAAETLYRKEIEYLKEKCNCDDIQQECTCDEVLVLDDGDKKIVIDTRGI